MSNAHCSHPLALILSELPGYEGCVGGCGVLLFIRLSIGEFAWDRISLWSPCWPGNQYARFVLGRRPSWLSFQSVKVPNMHVTAFLPFWSLISYVSQPQRSLISLLFLWPWAVLLPPYLQAQRSLPLSYPVQQCYQTWASPATACLTKCLISLLSLSPFLMWCYACTHYNPLPVPHS